jgi:hypothetical protein
MAVLAVDAVICIISNRDNESVGTLGRFYFLVPAAVVVEAPVAAGLAVLVAVVGIAVVIVVVAAVQVGAGWEA